MNTATMMLRVESLFYVNDSFGAPGWDVDDATDCSVDEFAKANEGGLTDVDRAVLAHMAVGDVLQFGGGAAPMFRVTRIS